MDIMEKIASGNYYLVNKEKVKKYIQDRKNVLKFNCNVCHKSYHVSSIYAHINSASHIIRVKEMKESIPEIITRVEIKKDGTVLSTKWDKLGKKIPEEPPQKVKCEICHKEIYDYESHCKSKVHNALQNIKNNQIEKNNI